MTDLATMLKKQMENNIAASLDAAVASGDAQTARKVAQQYADLAVASVPKAVVKGPPTQEEIKKALTAKAPWFGIDPRKSAKVVELGKMMDPTRFDTAEKFVDELLKAFETDDKKSDPGDDDETDNDDENDEGENAEGDDEDEDPASRRNLRAKRRNGTAATELNAGSRGAAGNNLRRAYETGDIKLLPKNAADEIKKSADKYTQNASKEAKAAFIANAVKARARADLIATGKFNARDNKLT